MGQSRYLFSMESTMQKEKEKRVSSIEEQEKSIDCEVQKPAILKTSGKSRRYSRSGSVSFKEQAFEVIIPQYEGGKETIREDSQNDDVEIHQKKLFEISRDLDIADVHQLLLNKNETEDDDSMIKEKL